MIFVWNGTPDKIKRKSLILPVTEGGLGMPDCRNFCNVLKIVCIKVLKIVCIKRFYDKSEDVRWKLVFANSLESLGGMLLPKCNLNLFKFILLKRHSNHIFILCSFSHACSITLFIYCILCSVSLMLCGLCAVI